MKTIFRPELEEFHRSQVFGQEVGWVFVPINKEDFHELSLYYFLNIMKADVNVFGPFFGHWVTGDKYRALVIPTYRYGSHFVAELPQKGMHPDYLAAAV